MGAFGYGPFENNDAMEWLSTFHRENKPLTTRYASYVKEKELREHDRG